MNDIITVKCPWCSTPLRVRNQPGIENKSITCPVCSKKSPFTSFTCISAIQPVSDGSTQYRAFPATSSEHQLSHESKAKMASNPIDPVVTGMLSVESTGQTYFLKPGRNVIGRRATSSGAMFQIDTRGDKTVSREHIIIEVKNEPSGEVSFYISLYKDQVSPTFIGSEPLLPGDIIKLKPNDNIRLNNLVIKFEIIDPEKTQVIKNI